jgi:hypothetical protein
VTETWTRFSVEEDDTRGESYAVWCVVADEITTYRTAKDIMTSEYEKDPRPMRIVSMQSTVLDKVPLSAYDLSDSEWEELDK